MRRQAVRVKDEPVDDDSLDLDAPQAIADGDDFDDDDDGILEDTGGTRYYQDAGFKIKQVVHPTIVQRAIALSRTKYLKLDPEYQREVVWDEARASALIASLFQGYFIPPIIFNVLSQAEPLNDGTGRKILKHYRICVDGKQRLTSIQKFMEGHIGVLDSNVPAKRWYYCHPKVNGVEKDSTHNIFEESTRQFFRSRAFCCYEYSELPESVEENMFQLVQRGMPLTPAEKMRALSTKWASFTKQYEEDYPMVVNLIKQSRASGFRAVITIFCQILEVASPSGNKRTNRDGVGNRPILQSSPQVLTKLLLDDKSLDEDTKFKFKQVFDRYQRLVEMSSTRSPTGRLGFKIISDSAFDPAPEYLRERGVGHVKTFSPIELLATAVLLFVHLENRSDAMLLGDIMEMRHYLREKHTDLRINQVCWNTAWEYIDSVMISRRGGEGAVRSGMKDARRQRVHAQDDGSEDGSSNEEVANEISPHFPSTPGISIALANGSSTSVNAVAQSSQAEKDTPIVSIRQKESLPRGSSSSAINGLAAVYTAPSRKRNNDNPGQSHEVPQGVATKRMRS
ncbi:MAG: hypothetical protein M1818_007338 [Claussenomyces sp. TS43310]|nr:MAG: hypothetical protein M1818_007338 [Claussenomyces sp. TS43310]